MRLFPAELEIGPDEGFTQEKDIFSRRAFGDHLTGIVRRIEDPGVILLDAPWGTGKTTFIKMWRGELKKAGVPSIYFDAFANDYQDSAFVAVASQIIAEAQTLKPRHKKEIAKFTANAVQVAKVVGRTVLGIGIRAASAGVIDAEDLKGAIADIAKDAGTEASKAIDEALKTRLESFNSDRTLFDNFKVELGAMAELLGTAYRTPTQGDELSSSNLPPLVFVIDELDRCRPTFALELLEKIKHFFSVPNVIFVIVTSLSQLEMAVKFAYGDIDARKYLEKFYHLRLLFPAGSPSRPDMGTATYLRYLECPKGISEIIVRYQYAHPLSFRTLERIVAYTKLVQAGGRVFVPQIVALLSILRVTQPEIYALARTSSLTFNILEKRVDFAS